MFSPAVLDGRRSGAVALTTTFNAIVNRTPTGSNLGLKRHSVLIELSTDLQPAPWSRLIDVSSKRLQILQL